MFLCQISGKLSGFIPASESGEEPASAWVTITERRWNGKSNDEVKHWLIVPSYQERWAAKCVEKGFNVIVIASDPREVTDAIARDAGYSLVMNWQSCFIP